VNQGMKQMIGDELFLANESMFFLYPLSRIGPKGAYIQDNIQHVKKQSSKFVNRPRNRKKSPSFYSIIEKEKRTTKKSDNSQAFHGTLIFD
jgi:hypothetical protein